jgi:RimJ/RimL family protein N-acetyltransferase
LNDPEINRYTEARYTVWSAGLVDAWFERETNRRKVFGIFNNDEFCGTLCLGPISQRHGTAEVGILLGFNLGRGIGTRALKDIIKYGYEAELGKLEAHVLAENARSRKAFERAGFVQEGVLRKARQFEGRRMDVIVYGLLYPEVLYG